MEFVFSALFVIGPAGLVIGLVAVPAYLIAWLIAPEPKQHPSILRYLALALGLGAAGFAIGTMLGIFGACFIAASGNLCGLAGVFGTGPLLAGAAAVYHAHTWYRKARAAT